MSGSGSGFYSQKDSEALEKAIKGGIISKNEHDLIVGYASEMTARYQLSHTRILKIVATLLGWKKNKLILVDYTDLTMMELYTSINNLNKGKNQRGHLFAQNTKHDYVIILKRFLIWLIRSDMNRNLDELKIRDIKNPSQNNDTTHPDEILNPEEIVAMISACEGSMASRNRALIATQYEAATRIGELGRVQWRDVLWDEYGAKLRIEDTKTRKIRMARLTHSISSKYLAAWRDDYPGEPEGDAYVFVSERGDFLTYWGVLRIFKESAERAGIKKRVVTHLFRKSRGTHLIEQGLPTANVVELMWANQNTKQIRTYIRMSPIEQDRVMLKHAGIISEEESKAQERRVTGKMCTICHTQNTPTARYCSGCGIGLSEEMQERQRFIRQAAKDPETLMEMMQAYMQGR